MTRTARIRVNLDTPFGPFRGEMAVEDGPMRLAELVPTALALTSNLVERAIHARTKAGESISCRAGCGACCRQLVMISLPEAFFLADMLQTLEGGARAQLEDRLRNARFALENAQLIEELKLPQADESGTSFPVVRRYFDLALPCPFLVDESCSIHPNRPIPCRDFNVTSDPSLCADPYSNTVTKVPTATPLTIPLAKLTAIVTQSPLILVPLALLPSVIAEHEAVANSRWPGLDLFQLFLQLTGESLENDRR